MTEDDMVGWHHWLNGHESEQAMGDGEGQGSLEYCSPWDRKESDTTEPLNNNNAEMSNTHYQTWSHPHRGHGVRASLSIWDHETAYKVEDNSHLYSLVVCMRACMLSHSVMSNSATPWAVACQTPLSMGFSRQEYWTGLPLSSPEDLPNPEIKA